MVTVEDLASVEFGSDYEAGSAIGAVSSVDGAAFLRRLYAGCTWGFALPIALRSVLQAK